MERYCDILTRYCCIVSYWVLLISNYFMFRCTFKWVSSQQQKLALTQISGLTSFIHHPLPNSHGNGRDTDPIMPQLWCQYPFCSQSWAIKTNTTVFSNDAVENDNKLDRTKTSSQHDLKWMIPVAGVAAQSKQIVVEAFNRFLLQHVVDSVAAVQFADRIVFIKWRLCHWRHFTHIDHSYYFTLRGVQSIAMSVSVCQLAYLKNQMANFHHFVCMLPVAVAQTFTGGVAMLCTSGFVDDIMFSISGPYGASCVFLGNESIIAKPKILHHSNQMLLNDKDEQVHIVGCIPEQSLPYMIALFHSCKLSEYVTFQ